MVENPKTHETPCMTEPLRPRNSPGAPHPLLEQTVTRLETSLQISVILKHLIGSHQIMFPLLYRQVPHIADKIFRYLDFDDYLTAREVCKEWREYIENGDHLCACNGDEEGSGRHLLSATFKSWRDLKKMFRMSFSGPIPKLVTMSMSEPIRDACSSNSAERIHVVTQRSILKIDIANMTVLEELIFPQEHQKKYTFGFGISATLNGQQFHHVREGQQQHRFRGPVSGNYLEYVGSSPINRLQRMTEQIMNYEEEKGLHTGTGFDWQNRKHNVMIIEEFCSKYTESRQNVERAAHELYLRNNAGQVIFIFCLAKYSTESGERITHKTYVRFLELIQGLSQQEVFL